MERGIAVAQGYQRLRKALPDILAKREDVLSLRMRHTIEDLAEEWRHLDKRIEAVSVVIQALAEDDGPCDRLMTMPGVAHIISTATVAAIGDGRTFERGRDFAAWLGLVPRQISTGDRTILGKISKRGNRYLRTLYCQAARVVLLRPTTWERNGLKGWIESKRKRLHHNKLAIALANKLARIAWALLTKGRDYEVRKLDVASAQPA